jgi:Flp pilus assembly protein TadG
MNSFGFLRRVARILGGLREDEDGHVLIYFTIMLPVTVGMIGLALDGGAFHHLHSDLQELADASALAGAAELDGRDDAITRATDRAQKLLSNDPHWSNTALNASGVQITAPTFYSSLNPDTVTTDPTQASYIKVTTVTREVKPAFVPLTAAMLRQGAPSNGQANASAVAGSSPVACNVQPLMLCNPYEGTSNFHATAGQLFVFKQKGSTGGFSPGDFGLVDPPGVNSSGAKTIRNLLAAQTPNFCYVDNISPRPGQLVGDISNAVNVRFDLVPSGNVSGMDQTPAPNVIKGTVPEDCGKGRYSPTQPALPGGTSKTTVGSLDIYSTMDQTAADSYWRYHHTGANGAGWPAGTTRFQAYCQELGLGSDCLGSNSPPPWAAGTEAPAPQCASVSTGDYKRRLISVAIVNCQANNVKGNSATSLRSNEYGVFFITDPSPVSGTTQGTIPAEFVKTITQGDCAANPSDPYCAGLHQIVQLYR